jgi:CheY-like chemotaxis protein
MTDLTPPASPSASLPSVLVVEDHLETRIFLEAALDERFTVAAVGRASAALQAAQHRVFDLLVLDIALGDGVDGVELLHQLRAQPGYADVPALAVTAHALPRDRQHYLEVGFDAYLSKPFFQEDILRVVDALMSSASHHDTPSDAPSEVE